MDDFDSHALRKLLVMGARLVPLEADGHEARPLIDWQGERFTAIDDPPQGANAWAIVPASLRLVVITVAQGGARDLAQKMKRQRDKCWAPDAVGNGGQIIMPWSGGWLSFGRLRWSRGDWYMGGWLIHNFPCRMGKRSAWSPLTINSLRRNNWPLTVVNDWLKVDVPLYDAALRQVQLGDEHSQECRMALARAAAMLDGGSQVLGNSVRRLEVVDGKLQVEFDMAAADEARALGEAALKVAWARAGRHAVDVEVKS